MSMHRLLHAVAASSASALVFLGAAQAQSTAPTSVTGTLAITSNVGLAGNIGFSCTGEPTCVGTYTAGIREQGCSNTLPFSGAVQVTGLDLARTGLLTPFFAFSDFEFQPLRNADGTCAIKPGSLADGPPLQLIANWGGETGSLHFEQDDPQYGGVPNNPAHIVMDGTFTASRPAPPTPVFPMTVTGSITQQSATVQAQFQYRPQDVGTTPNVYVFAVAPAQQVKDAVLAKSDAPVQCVLAQLGAGGQLSAVSPSTIQKAVDAVVTAQGASVNVLNNVATPSVAGATFFVGYGSSPATMIGNGVNRSAATVPGDVVCKPTAPQTGWWWNPAEDGRGFSVEVHGNNIFFAGFLYDATGRSTWYVATGPASMDGSYYTGPLYAARGGQTLGGAYPGSPVLSEAGTITLAFNNDSQGTMVWPGGTVPIQRFDIVAGGAADAPTDTHPESGWWWNPAESGRGFFMEWQRGTLDMAGYLYDDQGNSVWYLAWNTMAPNATVFNGNWWSFANGQTLTGAWKPNQRINDNVAPVTVTFTSPTTATMTLPNGRTTALQRHRF